MNPPQDYESLAYVTPESNVAESKPLGPRFPAHQGKNPVNITRPASAAAPINASNAYQDYESLGQLNFGAYRPILLEAFQGTAIVGWHGKIEGQLANILNDAEKGRNYTYADKLREFLKIWRANEITGSINRETLEVLKAAADILSVDKWNFATYFRSLKDQLRILIASEEQLPRGMEAPGNEPLMGTHGGGGGAPPMSPDFGPEKEAGGGGGAPEPEMPGGGPGGAGGEAVGAPPAPGEEPTPGEGEAPGAEPGAPAPEEGEEEPPKPEDMPNERLGLA